MSVVNTQSEMAVSVSPVSEAWSDGGVLPGYPRDGAGSARTERRGTGRSGDSAMDALTRLSAVAALERLPVPALAMSRNGIILFANAAFAEMVGYERDGLAGAAFPEIFDTVPAGEDTPSGVGALANLVLGLRHREGWTVRARMSNSALIRRDDPLVLVAFDNLTDRLWGMATSAVDRAQLVGSVV
jgi:PAS domain-containing protein